MIARVHSQVYINSKTSKHLVPGDFPDVRLSDDQINYFKEKCEDMLAEVLETDMEPAHKFNWEQCKSRDGVTSFRGTKKRRNQNCRFYRSVGSTVGSMEEFVKGCINSKLRDYRYYSKSFAEDYADCEVLYNIESPTKREPLRHICLKWQCFNPSLYPAYDVVYLEYVGTTYDSTGERVGFSICQSVDLPDFPPFAIYKRAEVTEQSYIFRDSTTDGNVDITRSSYLVNKDTPTWIFDTMGLEKSFDILKLIKFVQTLRYSPKDFVPECDWVPDSCRSTCLVCEKKFGTFRGKHHCRCCGEIICSSCLLKKAVRYRDTAKEVKMCKQCVLKYKTDYRASRLSRGSSISSSAQSTSSSYPNSFATTVDEEPCSATSSLDDVASLSLEPFHTSTNTNTNTDTNGKPPQHPNQNHNQSLDQPKYSFNTSFIGVQSSIAEQDRLLKQIAGRCIRNSVSDLEPSDRIEEIA